MADSFPAVAKTSSLILPLAWSESSSARSVRYRMSLSAVCETGAGAVFSIFVSIAFKFLSAVHASEVVVCFTLDIFRVLLPPGVPATVGAKQLDLFANRLNDRLATVFADALYHSLRGMPTDIGANCVHRHSSRQGNLRRRFPTGTHDV